MHEILFFESIGSEMAKHSPNKPGIFTASIIVANLPNVIVRPNNFCAPQLLFLLRHHRHHDFFTVQEMCLEEIFMLREVYRGASQLGKWERF